MLQDLTILNGEMTPKFDVYNDIYSVSVKEDITSLEIDYVVDEDHSVEIVGNQGFISGENFVYINVIKENEQNTYTLIVNKEKTETTSTIDLFNEPVEIVEPLPEYVAPLIGVICFVIILSTFSVLFHKKRK